MALFRKLLQIVHKWMIITDAFTCKQQFNVAAR